MGRGRRHPPPISIEVRLIWVRIDGAVVARVANTVSIGVLVGVLEAGAAPSRWTRADLGDGRRLARAGRQSQQTQEAPEQADDREEVASGPHAESPPLVGRVPGTPEIAPAAPHGKPPSAATAAVRS